MKYCCKRFVEIFNKGLIRKGIVTLRYYLKDEDWGANIDYCPFCGKKLEASK